MRHVTVLLVMATVLLSVVPVAAQDRAQEAARRDLVLRARRARDAGNLSEALDLATRAFGMRPSADVRLMIAGVHDSLGHPLEALEQASRCVQEAPDDPSLGRQRDQVARECSELVSTLESMVGRLQVRVPTPVPAGLRVRVAGRDVPSTQLETPFPVRPGRVVVEATADGIVPFHTTVTVTAGRTTPVSLALERVSTHAALSIEGPPPPDAPAPPPPRRGPGAGPWALIALGAVGLASAVVFAVMYDNAVGMRDAACTTRGCLPISISHDQDVTTWSIATNVGLGVGVAGVAAGVIWYLVARPRREAPASRWGARPFVSPLAGGAVLGLQGGL
ncbi:MAG: hypothetical protein HY905_16735 [Deltaproteobacteria bacterium]|nr:hypothetical protein [Deltaproteobacteria bacterium]